MPTAEEWKIVFKNMVDLKDSKMSPTCNETEDLIHYFIGCNNAANIWLQIWRWWHGLTNQDINITEQDIILGLGNKKFKIIKIDQFNKIMSTVKWKIHANKQSGDTCCLYQVLSSIKQMIKIEELIAIKNDKINMHRQTWEDIECYLT